MSSPRPEQAAVPTRRRAEQPPPRRPRLPPTTTAVIAPVVVFVAAFAIAWFRLPAAARDTFWAEDAQVFSARALDTSNAGFTIFSAYDGYVHAVPQALAMLLWSTFPTVAMAQAFTAAACAVAAAVAALVFVLTGQWSLHPVARAMLAATTVLVPGLAYELLGNLANAHWFLLWLAPFLFLARPRSWVASAILAVIAFAVAATEIQAVLFMPLLLWRIRDRRRWPLLGGAAVGAAMQVVTYLRGGRVTGSGFPSVLSIIDGYVLQVPLVGLTGSGEAASALVGYSGWFVAFAALLPFALCAAAWAGLRRTRIAVVLAVAAASFLLWAGGYALNRASAFGFHGAGSETLVAGVPLLRYAIVPSMLLFGLVALAVHVGLTAGGTARRAALGVVILVAALWIAYYRVDVPTPRNDGPTWTAGLAEARGVCDGDGVTDVRVAPLYGQWALPLPCDRLPR